MTDFINELLVEEKTISWKIERFDVIRRFDALIPTARIEFSIGETIGLPTKWAFYHVPKESGEGDAKKKWIGIVCALVSKPENAQHVYAQYHLRTTSPSAHVIEIGPSFKDFDGKQEGWEYPEVIDQSINSENLPLTAEGALTFQIDFKIYAKKVPKLDDAQQLIIKDLVHGSSGVRLERKSITWKIENFDVILKSDELITCQYLKFEAGSTIGLNTKWRFTLQQKEIDGKKWVGLYINLYQKPKKVENVNAEFNSEIIGGTLKKFGSGTLNFGSPSGWGFPGFIDLALGSSVLPLVNGALFIRSEFTLYAPFQTPSIGQLEMDFESKSMGHLNDDLIEYFSDLTDVTLISKDKIKIPSNKSTLSARSPVFRKMFRAKMKESENGTVEIDDLSGRTLQVLNKYLCTGKLDPNWKSNAILEELVLAADKYHIAHLTDFLDMSLGSACSKQNVKALVILTEKIGMKTAEKDLTEYLKKHAIDANDLMVFTKRADADKPKKLLDLFGFRRK